MICCECGSVNASQFFVESIPCSHCEEVNIITYNACEDCGLVWKANGDNVLDMVHLGLPEDLDGEVVEFLVTQDRSDSMQDLIHKCLRCETVSYEIKPNHYHCPDCGFEWEVL